MRFLDHFPLVTGHPELFAGLLAAGVFVLAGVRALLHRTRIGNRLDSAFTLLSVGLVAGAISMLGGGGAEGVLFLDAYALFIAAVAIGLVRIGLVLFVDFYLRERKGAAVSTIFRDVATLITYFLIILSVLRYTLDINVTSLVATSAVLTAIIGLALQDVLGSLISGLVLELEAPFSRGDWIHVGNFEGTVLEVGWRTTKIRTRVNEVVTLPNTYLSREPVVNYSRPDPYYADSLRFEAAYEASPHSVKQAVSTVLAAEPAVQRRPVPEVRTAQYDESGIQYEVRYWVTDFAELERIRDRIMTNVWYALRRAGVRIPFPARDLFVYSRAPASVLDGDDVVTTLRRVPLLAPLSEQNLTQLATRARWLAFGLGEAVVREGEPGASCYVIERGALAVVIGRQNGSAGRVIAKLGPGDFFGEMSLLAGEPRSATVVAQEDVAVLEVGRAAFQQIVAADPQILEPISQIATHRMEVQREQRRFEEVIPPFANDPAAQRLLRRIRAFFRIGE